MKKRKFIFQHIMKTAGMSFHEILKKIYKDKYLRYHVYRQKLTDHDYDKYDCISGHLLDLKYFKKNYSNAFYVTWLREPIDRLYSHYRYWSIGGDNIEPQHSKFRQEKPSFIEFARKFTYPAELWKQNFCGYSIKDFDFIGVVERWDEDFEKIRNIMDWPEVPKLVINKNAQKTGPLKISEKEREEIKTILTFDYKIYNKVLKNN